MGEDVDATKSSRSVSVVELELLRLCEFGLWWLSGTVAGSEGEVGVSTAGRVSSAVGVETAAVMVAREEGSAAGGGGDRRRERVTLLLVGASV